MYSENHPGKLDYANLGPKITLKRPQNIKKLSKTSKVNE